MWGKCHAEIIRENRRRGRLLRRRARPLAQIQTVDPNQPDSWQTAPEADARRRRPSRDRPTNGPRSSSSRAARRPPAADPDGDHGPPADDVGDRRPPSRAAPCPASDVFNAAEGVFGRGAQGLAGILENILRDQGEPVAYIAGSEAGGAFVFGVRYGSGVMRHQVEGERTVYWTGPSLGFDVGADANKVFVLVYNLHDSQDLFRRYPAGRGPRLFRRRLQRPIYAPRRRRADPDPARRRHAARRQCRLYALFRAQPLAALLDASGQAVTPQGDSEAGECQTLAPEITSASPR